MTRILDRYILKEVGGVFLFGIALFTLFLTVNHLFFIARIALQQQIPLATVARFLLLRIPYFASFSMPMALLLGTLLAFGRLSDRHEVVAMRTSGISLPRIALPVLAAGVMVGSAAVVLGEWVAPIAEERYAAEFQTVTGIVPIEGSHILFRERTGGQTSVIYARRFVEEGDFMEGLTVNQIEQGRLVRVIEAARARYSGSGWSFEDGILYLLTGPTTVTTHFDRLEVAITRTPREILLERKPPSEMTIRELQAYIGVLRRTGESILQYVVWLHSRLAIPASSPIFALLAVPLGLRPHRSGPAIGLGLTIVILLGYYLLMNTTLFLGQTGRMPAVLAAWTPNLVAGGLGTYLLWRAR